MRRVPQAQDALLELLVAGGSPLMPPLLTPTDVLCADRHRGQRPCLSGGGSHASCGTGKFSRAAASQTPSCSSQNERSPIGPSVVV
ncbi:hypothetical protein GCM10010439_17530 [Actinocorallia aurantiaca]|uniref:Secreted protein n=1 Tax=Actinocorallia aurantiaca TaxID=46204 RepID=A0ABN3U2L3_9ACTN